MHPSSMAINPIESRTGILPGAVEIQPVSYLYNHQG